MVSDLRGQMSASVPARCRREGMRCLHLPVYLGLRTRARVMSKERWKGLWILGHVMRTEFERGSSEDTCGEGFKLQTLAERSFHEGFEYWTLVGRSGQESM